METETTGEILTASGVPTWYAEYGTGDPLVLLHPGGVDSRAWGPTAPGLTKHFRVLTPDRRGHGRTADVDGPMTYGAMADDTIAWMEALELGRSHLLGCSDGAIVGLLLALRRPDLVRHLGFVAGVFHRQGWHPSALAEGDPPPFFIDNYSEISPDGREHYPVIAEKLRRMHAEEPTLDEADLADMAARTLVMVGDDDEVILEHALAMYRALPDGESWPWCLAPPTAYSLRSPICATRSWLTSSRPIRSQPMLRFDARTNDSDKGVDSVPRYRL